MSDGHSTEGGADPEHRSAGAPVRVTTSAGGVIGRWRGDVALFAGIPFAEPPVGALRFRPPVAAHPWDGELDASGFGPVSPQNPSMMDALFGGETERWDEDCLRLNVWTSRPGPSESPLPVMVWIHGGGFEMGSGSSPLYDGAAFAREGVVLVSLNYRLGSLGFLELGALDPAYAGSGNNGLLDQVLALEWVRDNIAEFGGDPGQVTIFGQSAGAMSVSLLMCMPRAAGLFHRAIAQSGATVGAKTPELAAADAAEFLAAADITTMAELLDAPTERLLAAHGALAAARMGDPEAVIKRTGNPLGFLLFRPVADGGEVPLDPLAALADGCARGIPLITGSTSEEWKLFTLLAAGPSDEDHLLERLAALNADPAATLAVYRDEHPDADLRDLEGAILTDLVFRMPSVRMAEAQAAHAPVFEYLWTWRSPAWGGQIGAAHAVEIPFVFRMLHDERLHLLVGPEPPDALAEAIHSAWVSFATTGVPLPRGGAPSGAGGVELRWPEAGSSRQVLVFDDSLSVAEDPLPLTRRHWSA